MQHPGRKWAGQTASPTFCNLPIPLFRSAYGAFGDDAVAVGISHLAIIIIILTAATIFLTLRLHSVQTGLGNVCSDFHGGLFLLPLQKQSRFWPSQCLDSVHLDAGGVPSQTSEADGFRACALLWGRS